MLLGETFAVAISSIRSNALRSMLTMLGIIIGVGAVITMVALGSGAQKAVEDRIAALGANVFTVFAGQGRSGAIMITDRTVLSTDDYEALRRDATLLSAVVPEAQQAQQVVYGNQNRNLQVIGTTANYTDVRNYTVPYGRMFTDGDDAARQRYAVLGSAVPEMLGGNPAAMIHQTIFIRGIPFEIIGVLSPKGASGGFQNPDEQILIPLQTAQYRVFGTNRLRSIVDRGAGRRSDRAGHGRSGAGAPARAPHPPGRAERLHHPQPAGRAADPAAGHSRLHHAACQHRGGEPGGRRHRHHEHHAGLGHRADPRDRRAQGARAPRRRNILLQFLIEALTLCILGGVIGVSWSASRRDRARPGDAAGTR